MYSNRSHEGGEQPGAAATTLYHEGGEFGHCEEAYGEQDGETITEADAFIRGLAPGLNS
jgi:hypothetical protein